jgi:hydrogenase nickel incorporation protein HypA/HybF
MHELAIAESVVDAITARTGTAPVTQVRLEVGRLSGVVADALRFSFELVASGTGLDGACLDIDEPDGRAKCADCGLEFAVPDLILLCACGSADIHVLAGDELRIISVQVQR